VNPTGYDFDPTHGMDLTALLAVVPPKPAADFAAFWEDRYRAARVVAPEPRILGPNRRLGAHAVFDLSYSSTGGIRIGGWLLLPLNSRVRRGIVVGHGYDGRDRPDAGPFPDGTAVLLPCFRGTGRSPAAGVSSDPALHVLHHIRDRDRYILGGCVDDLWLAVTTLLALFPQVAGNVAYLGASFGGGIGALAAPWDTRICRMHLEVPTFGHHALRLTLPCVGSGQAVRDYQHAHDFNVMETLAYYDAATAARELRIPTLVAAALFDPAVPPAGQFAIFNAIPAGLRRLFLLEAGHHEYPGRAQQMEELGQEVCRFLREA
jgi:cephalosporin-C deacetylase